MKKKLLILPLMALTVGTVTGCNKNSVAPRSGSSLMVCVYDGGYGTEWIKQVALDYETKTGVHVEWAADQNILTRLQTDLKSPSYDIYMSHDISWQSYAAQGLLEPLDDLYESDVEGTGKTFKQRLTSGAAEISKFNDHYYKSCYTLGAGGFVYNVDLFEQHNWAVPTTYDELVSLCQTIVAAEIPVGAGGLNDLVPIAWSSTEFYWDYPVFEWWAQLAGLEKIEKWKSMQGTDGKNSTGYQVYDPNGNYKEFIQAYEMWYNLIALNHSFSNNNPQDTVLNNACALFASGQAAMIPYAQWAKWEIQSNSGTQFTFDIAMMKTPRANSSVTTDYNYNVGFGDSIIVGKNIPEESKVMAKDFIRYLAGKEACKTFVEKARGAFLAFDYSIVDLGDLLNDKYVASVYSKLTTCTQFNLVSTAQIAIVNASAIMPWIDNDYYYTKAFAKPSDYTPSVIGAAIYSSAQKSWPSWMQRAGVHD